MKLLSRSAVALGAAVTVLAGTASPAAAIVGGQEATHRYNGMLHLTVDYPSIGRTLHCGAGLYDAWHVAVNAHCVLDNLAIPDPVAVEPSRIMVRAGTNDRTSAGQTARGTRSKIHRNFRWVDPNTGKPVADIALVTLDQPIHAPTMQLPPAAASKPGTSLRAIGWGLTEYPPPADNPDPLPTMLRQRDITQLPAASCDTEVGVMSKGDLCVSTGPCFGDSGSPVLTRAPGRTVGANRRWVWQGLVSRETDSADPCGKPIIATSLAYYRTWLAKAAACTPKGVTTAAAACTPERTTGGKQTPDQRRLVRAKLPFLSQLTDS
ncbi:trypsin-like serine protease [Actinoplanes sp. NBRC 103695]|uniref:S1 family peptidase n=1 Tax=Actinoplanes sp. NBRC 103695 TaxID=3032202 RepID=UPI0024A49BE3|nr:trypsin-like serine protease [Actinoplanes sp. NBRC 103695]GLZ01869.1 serine protease [Actinoplanes sp. NBRC 103695]